MHGWQQTENFMDKLDITAVIRMALIYVHLLGFAGAAAFVAQGDYALLGRSRIDMALLRRSASFVSVALAVLWVSGLAVIWLDTQFDLAVLLTKPKLLAKLSIVAILTVNGMALHTLAFPRLENAYRDPQRAVVLPCVLGGISAATWMYAAFVGVGKAVAPTLGYIGFMGLYAVAVAMGVGMAMLVIRKRLAAQAALEASDHGVVSPKHKAEVHPIRVDVPYYNKARSA
jgi:uncharacterized SAM-binding protein YcdF (DUF218 family)